MPKKIVIVDDQPHLRLLIEQSLEELEDEGVTLLLAADGGVAEDGFGVTDCSIGFAPFCS